MESIPSQKKRSTQQSLPTRRKLHKTLNG